MLYWLKVLLEVIILPPNSLVIAAGVGLAMKRRYRILGNVLVAISTLIWFVLSMPVVSSTLVQSRIEH